MSKSQIRDCQKNALIAFEKYYYEDGDYDRGIISMCCGSGKSYTGYLIIKKCLMEHNEKFFIIATSRKHLIYQLFEDYEANIKRDNLNFNLKIMGGSGERYPKNTLSKPDEIKYNLQQVRSGNQENNRPLLIITTYNSAKTIIKQINDLNTENKDNMIVPDLIILDEAHNTTGDTEKFHRDLIKKDNDDFCANKYLFMTATPVQLLLKNNDAPFQNDETIFTMTNENIYGKIIYEYTFHDGFRDKILVPFEVIYFSQNDEIPEDIVKELKYKSKEEKKDIYFKCISDFLIESIKLKKMKHTLIFLKNREKVNLMEKFINQVCKEQNFECDIQRILCQDNNKKRTEALKKFRRVKNKPSILLSVGIFDEGVDETCIDSVMFAEERNTESKIVQNIGRCLRIHQGKNKGYVIIPNIVHEFNNDVEDEDCESKSTGDGIETQKTYSSYFKKIRQVANILNVNVKNQFYGRYIKGNIPDRDYDDDYKEKLEQADEIITLQEKKEDKINNKQVIDDDDKEKINDNLILSISKYYDLVSSSNNISNERLINLKNRVKKQGITTIKGYRLFAQANKIPYVHLHDQYKSEWISWGDFLLGETFGFEEAKNFIKGLNLNITLSDEWIDYYMSIINGELSLKTVDGVTEEIVQNIIKIPNRPKEYYKGEWIDWSDFLGIDIQKKFYIAKENSNKETINAENNIKNLINDDFKKINSLKNGQFNDVNLEIDLTLIKNFIDAKFGIETEYSARVLLKANGNYDRCCINCYKKNDSKFKPPPIVILPEERKFKFDPMIADKNYNQININRTKNEHFQNANINRILSEIISKCREIVKTSKK